MTATIEKPPEVRGPPPASAGTPGLPPLRSRYVLAALLSLVALFGAIGWYGTAWTAAEHQYLEMQQAGLPNVVNVPERANDALGGPKYYVYAEGLTTVTSVRVTNTAGQVFPVTMRTESVDNFGGLTPKQVARFDVSNGPRPPLPLRVEVSGSGYVRVGDFDATQPVTWERWGMAALLVVNIGASIAIIVVPIARRRRHRAA